MLEVSAAGWAATIGLIVALLAFDLGRAARRPHVVRFREAALWSVFYIARSTELNRTPPRRGAKHQLRRVLSPTSTRGSLRGGG